MRNMSRGRGIGFFEAGNFFPDFILWRIDGNKQHITFVDPKGILNLEAGWDDPKILFYQTIKDIEARLKRCDPNVTLESFIISNTPSAAIALRWSKTPAEMRARNLLFQEDSDHIEQLLAAKP